MRIIPRRILNRLSIDVDVIVVALTFPWARGGVGGWLQRLRFVDNGVRWKVHIAFHVLEMVGLGNGGTVNGGFGMHLVELEIVEVGR